MRDSIAYFLRVVIARAYVRVVGAQRELSWIIGETLLPLLGVTGFVMVYRAMKAPPEFTGFVILGGMMVAFWANMLWSMALQFFWEKETGNLARYLMAPLPRPALLMGMAVGGIIMSATRSIVILVVSVLLFKVRFTITDPWMAAGAFALTMTALYGLGMMLTSVFFVAGRGANYGMQALFEPGLFLGGFYFPLARLGVFVASASAALIPVALGLDALRQLMFARQDIGFLPPATEMWLLTLMSVVFTWLSVLAIRWMENKGRANGRLLVREQ